MPNLESFIAASLDTSARVYPGCLGVGKCPGLTAEQRNVEARSVFEMESDLEGFISRYEAANGNYLGADSAKELFSLYTAGPKTRRWYVEAVHYSSGALIKEIWQRKLAQPPAAPDEYVLFTAGGPGAGKTAAIESQPACRELVKNAFVVHDTMLAEFERGVAKFAEVLASGRRIAAIYVYRPVENAMVGVIDRAKRTGRIVTLDDVAHKHYESQETFIQLAEHYQTSEHTRFIVIDNSGPLGSAQEMPLARFKEQRVTDWQTISRRALETLDAEYQKRLGTEQEITASLYINLRDEGIDLSAYLNPKE
jgi:hypothetical protein